MEAALAGALVCGTRTGIFDDWREFGFVTAEVGEEQALADAIMAVIDQPDLYDVMLDEAYRKAISRNRFWTADQYDEVYQKT